VSAVLLKVVSTGIAPHGAARSAVWTVQERISGTSAAPAVSRRQPAHPLRQRRPDWRQSLSIRRSLTTWKSIRVHLVTSRVSVHRCQSPTAIISLTSAVTHALVTTLALTVLTATTSFTFVHLAMTIFLYSPPTSFLNGLCDVCHR